jgi:hypothetical protein
MAATVFGLLILGVVIEAVYELAIGPHPLANDWLHDTLIFGSAAMCADPMLPLLVLAVLAAAAPAVLSRPRRHTAGARSPRTGP